MADADADADADGWIEQLQSNVVMKDLQRCLPVGSYCLVLSLT
jgi:hypothetical protein